MLAAAEPASKAASRVKRRSASPMTETSPSYAGDHEIYELHQRNCLAFRDDQV
jgi:hypothetical protein